MKKFFTLILLLVICTAAFAGAPKNQYVRIKTAYGTCIIRLYNETPKHRDNFIKLAKQHFFDGTLFHRVIQNFMIQGGEPGSKDAKPGEALGSHNLNYTVEAEFRDSIFHKRGVLAAARNSDEVNPKRASSASQFYIVEGKRYTDAELDKVEQLPRYAGMNYKIPASQREWYKTVGGAPGLDRLYTVYGEVVSGIDMIDRIAAVAKDARDRPLQDVPITVTLLSKRECRQLDKILGL
jgi:cyclophilin family peptidyl-prolyl cis-trans isomerase